MVDTTRHNDPLSEVTRKTAMHKGFNLIEQYKNTFRALQQSDLSRLRFVYAENVVYRDPVREIRGIVALEDYFDSMYAGIAGMRFEFTDQLVGDRTAYLKWLLHYSTPSSPERRRSVRGVSHLQIGDRIEFQENFYDLDQRPGDRAAWHDTLSRWLGKKSVHQIPAMRS